MAYLRITDDEYLPSCMWDEDGKYSTYQNFPRMLALAGILPKDFENNLHSSGFRLIKGCTDDISMIILK